LIQNTSKNLSKFVLEKGMASSASFWLRHRFQMAGSFQRRPRVTMLIAEGYIVTKTLYFALFSLGLFFPTSGSAL